MAHKFRLFVSIDREEVIFKCRGRFDGSAACEVLRRIEEYSNGPDPIIIDLEGVNNLQPIGMEVLKSAIDGRYLKLGKKVFLRDRKKEELCRRERFGT